MDKRTQYKYTGQNGVEYSAALGDVLVIRCHNSRYHLANIAGVDTARFMLQIETLDLHIVKFNRLSGRPAISTNLQKNWEIMGPMVDTYEHALKAITVCNKILDNAERKERREFWRFYMIDVQDGEDHQHEGVKALTINRTSTSWDQSGWSYMVYTRSYTRPGYEIKPTRYTEFVWFDPENGYHERIQTGAIESKMLTYQANVHLSSMEDEYRAQGVPF